MLECGMYEKGLFEPPTSNIHHSTPLNFASQVVDLSLLHMRQHTCIKDNVK